MTPETIAIIAVGVGLGGLMLTLFQLTHRRIDSLERRMDHGFEAVERRIEATDRRISGIEQQQAGLAERLARLEGLVEAIRDMLIRTPTSP